MKINRGTINSIVALLSKYNGQDLMVVYALLEVLEAINRKGHVSPSD